MNLIATLMSKFKFVCRRILDLEEEVLQLRERVASTAPQGTEVSDGPTNSALAVSSSPRASQRQIEIDSNANPNKNATSTGTVSTAQSSINLNGGSSNIIATPLPRTLNGLELGSDCIRDLFSLWVSPLLNFQLQPKLKLTR